MWNNLFLHWSVFYWAIILAGLSLTYWMNEDVGLRRFLVKIINAMVVVGFVSSLFAPRFMGDLHSTVSFLSILIKPVFTGKGLVVLNHAGDWWLSLLWRLEFAWVTGYYVLSFSWLYIGKRQTLNIPILLDVRGRGQEDNGPHQKIGDLSPLPFVIPVTRQLETIERYPNPMIRAATELERGGMPADKILAALTTEMTPTRGSIVGTQIKDATDGAGGAEAAIRLDFDLYLADAIKADSLTPEVRERIVGTANNTNQTRWKEWAGKPAYSILRNIVGPAILWVTTAELNAALRKAEDDQRAGRPVDADEFWEKLLEPLQDMITKFDDLVSRGKIVQAAAIVRKRSNRRIGTPIYEVLNRYGYLMTRVGVEDFVEDAAVVNARRKLAEAQFQRQISVALADAAVAGRLKTAAGELGYNLADLNPKDKADAVKLAEIAVRAGEIRRQELGAEAIKGGTFVGGLDRLLEVVEAFAKAKK